jgi:hypothetical protein
VRKSGKALQGEQNEAVRFAVRKLVDRDFAGKALLAARAFGISQPSLSNFLAGKTGAGVRLLTAFSRYARVTLDDMIRGNIGISSAGKRSASAGPRDLPIRQAVEKLRGVVLPEALSYLEKTANDGAEVLTVAEWMEDGLAYHRQLQRRKRTAANK